MRVVAIVLVIGLVRVAWASEPDEPPEELSEAAPPPAYPERYLDRPLVLPAKMLAIHGVVRVNLTSERVASPVWIAPSVFYGVLPKLQVGITHDPGICLLGERDLLGTTVDECRGGLYDDFAVDGLYMLVDKPDKHFSIAGHGAIGASTFDPVFLYLRAGALARYTFGSRFAVIADFSLRLGLANRDEGNKEMLDLPVQLAVQATDKLVLFAEAGMLLPVAELTDGYYASIGLAGLYAIRANLDAGVRFELPRIAGGKATGSNASLDFRQLDLFITYRR
ncbi:MAG: hypothetical protein AB7T06_33210 [Kofleriaceae bacterium]